MLFRFFRIFVLCVFFLHAQVIFASRSHLSLDLQNANIADVIRLIAKFLQMNVIVSPAVSGVVTLHLHDAVPNAALDMFLASQELVKWEVGHVWFVAPRQEFIKHKQEENKWRELKDISSPLVTKVWHIQYGQAEEIVKLFQDDRSAWLSKRGRVRADARTNIIFMQDLPASIEVARQLIEQLDVPVAQILIEARLVSVDHDYEQELGIHFSVAQDVGRYSLAVAKLADGSLLDVKLAALENAGHVRLISSPSLFTANQQTASIEAGEEIPYQEVSESGGTAVVFKKAVLGLSVTPQLLPGNKLLLHMRINQDRPSNKMVQGVPTISTRQIQSNVLIKNGQTMVLGGIYETDQENGLQQVPFVGRIPFIGWLFRQTHTLKNKRELLVFVTPKVMEQSA